ncbi:hypothetical protein OA7_0017880 [Vibrio cyclitrophicus 1F53]|uniref:hypothetical protein n=2 Tax=Vibrio cyclitrophicus TaxID=47951 RepID=UPI00030AD176|nr:hypothetical protein [Vibrio cyclitrophicus]
MMNDKYLIDRKFPTIFDDALSFAEMAKNIKEDEDFYIEGRLARASILNTSLLPEVVANCLIEKLCLPKSVFKTIDRLDPLGKLDYFLWSHNGSSLDKGIREVQLIAELQSIRNLIVHPKAKKTEWVQVDERTREASFGMTDRLKIPQSSDDWIYDDAVHILRTTMEFLDYVLRTKARFDSQQVLRLLLNTSENLDGKNVYYTVSHEWRQFHELWSLKLDFMGMVQQPEERT